jgi:hypothetical protein
MSASYGYSGFVLSHVGDVHQWAASTQLNLYSVADVLVSMRPGNLDCMGHKRAQFVRIFVRFERKHRNDSTPDLQILVAYELPKHLATNPLELLVHVFAGRTSPRPVERAGRTCFLDIRTGFKVTQQLLLDPLRPVGANAWFDEQSVQARIALVNAGTQHRGPQPFWDGLEPEYLRDEQLPLWVVKGSAQPLPVSLAVLRNPLACRLEPKMGFITATFACLRPQSEVLVPGHHFMRCPLIIGSHFANPVFILPAQWG